MKRDCTHAPRDRALKAQFKRLVEACGGVEPAAAVTRVSAAMISNYGNVNTDAFPPLDVVLALEEVAGSPVVSALMVRMVSPVEAEADASLMNSVCALVGHLGQASRLVSAALVDGRIDASERLEISRVTDELSKAAQAMHRMAVEAV